MPRLGRGFPTHVKRAKAGISNVTVTLLATSHGTASLVQQRNIILLVTCATLDTLASLKLKSLTVLSVVSSTTASLATLNGVGRILSVTSSTTKTISRQISKLVSISSPTSISLLKSIGKLLFKVDTPIVGIAPGLFRIGPSKAVLLIQWRPFSLIVFNRIVRQ